MGFSLQMALANRCQWSPQFHSVSINVRGLGRTGRQGRRPCDRLTAEARVEKEGEAARGGRRSDRWPPLPACYAIELIVVPISGLTSIEDAAGVV